MKGDVENRIISALKKSDIGLTITQLVDMTEMSRSSIRTGLAKLEGARRVSIRKVGMAKVYSLLVKK